MSTLSAYNNVASDKEDVYLELKVAYINSILDKCDILTKSISTATEKNIKHVTAELGREIHSMKGTGAMYEIAMISPICHRFEDDIFSQEGDAHHHVSELFVYRTIKFLELIKTAAMLEKQLLANTINLRGF